MSGSDERFERALDGGASTEPGEDALAAFVEEVREAFPARAILAEEAHLRAIADAAREHAAAHQAPPERKESHVRIPRFRSLTAKLVVGLVVLMSSFGGLAFAGALPGGFQDGVANAAAGIGVDLPGGDDDATEPAEADDDTEAPEAEETDEPDAEETEAPEAEETDEPDAEETEAPEADDQGEDEQSGDQGEDEQSDAADNQDQESEADDQGEDEQSGDQGEDEQSGDQGEDQEANSGGED